MTNKKLNVVNVPNLRFPGFEGEWETRKLGEVGEIGRGKSKHRPRDADFLFGGKYPFIQTGDVKKADLYLTEYSQTYSEQGLKQSKLWNEDTLCITIAANIAETAILKIKACFPDSIIGLIPNQDKTTVLFIKYSFDKFKIHIQKLSQGVAQDNLNQEKLSKVEFNFPSLSEQKKISSFLSLIDERIQTQNKIIEQLETLIKGLSEKLFSQEIRFEEFKDEWEFKNLEEICQKAKSGGTPKSTEKKYYDGDIPFLSISDMTTQGKYLYSTERTISKEGLENSASWIVPVDSIIYSMYASVGLVSINKIELATSQAVLNLISKSNICTEYLYYYLVYFRKFVNKYITIGTQGNLNAETIKNFEINLPTLQEQTSIAQFLSSIDKKIQTERNLLDKYQSQKQFLLNNLFI